MTKRTSTKTSKRSSKTKFRNTSSLPRKELDATSVVAPPASEITKNISDASLRDAADVIKGANVEAQFGNGNDLNQQTGTGGSTGGLIASITTPGFDEGRVNGGNASADPKDGGLNIFGFSEKEKEAYGAVGIVFGAVGGVAAGVATAGAAVAASPVIIGAAAGVTIGAALVAGAGLLLEKVGTPVPDDITGTTPGVTITGKGIEFDPITGQGPTATEKLGQFTGDETTASGVILTQEEARNFQEAINQAQGTFLKDLNPMGESSSTTVIDERSLERVDLILAGGGVAGPTGNSFQQLAVAQDIQFTIATEALVA
ncbi:MAG: hypothetical protein ACOVNL_05650 [Prochlorococcaceae cyanobacterium]|jgi:hypothetical protein